jgi:hypothetical protein
MLIPVKRGQKKKLKSLLVTILLKIVQNTIASSEILRALIQFQNSSYLSPMEKECAF